MRWRTGIERELASRADQRVLRWFEHVDRMDEYRMSRRMLITDVSGRLVRGRPRLGSMDGALCHGRQRDDSGGYDNARKIGRSGEPWCICRWLSVWHMSRFIHHQITSSLIMYHLYYRTIIWRIHLNIKRRVSLCMLLFMYYNYDQYNKISIIYFVITIHQLVAKLIVCCKFNAAIFALRSSGPPPALWEIITWRGVGCRYMMRVE